MKIRHIITTIAAALMLTACVPYQKEVTVTATGTPEQALYIQGLQDQIKQLQDQIKSKDEAMSKIAGNAVAIDAGLEKTPDSLGKPVIEAENGLIKTTAGEASDRDRADALERANALLQKDVAKANALYSAAGAQIDTLNGQIAARDQTIREHAGELAELQLKADQAEKDAKLKLEGTINDYEKKLKDIRDEQTRKERRLWVNALRYTGVALIVGGIVILAVSKMLAWIQGSILAIGGILVIVAGQGLDQLTQQWWWPWLCGGGVVCVVVGGGWYILHVWQSQRKQVDVSAAINDLKTEADAGVGDAKQLWEELQKHLTYRLGDDAVKKLQTEWTKLGLDSKK